MTRNTLTACAVLLCAAAAYAQVPPEGDPVAARTHAAPGLAFVQTHQPLSKLPASLATRLQGQITALGISEAFASYDLRAGHWGTLAPGKPLLPGSGAGNSLTWSALGGTAQRMPRSPLHCNASTYPSTPRPAMTPSATPET